MSELKDYIGDGVYADLVNGVIRITTENGIEATNTIYLEPAVFEALKRYADRVWDRPKNQSPKI